MLYPLRDPYRQDYLDVGNSHMIYFAEYGNPDGVPIILNHGGPGCGSRAEDHRYFDPDFYRIIIYDQRGSGHSIPFGALEHNTPDALVADLELLREVMGVEKWCMAGGSWGSTLTTLYMVRHPERLYRACIWAVALGDEAGARILTDAGETSRFRPKYFIPYEKYAPPECRGDLMEFYNTQLNADDLLTVREAALHFILWDSSLLTPEIDETLLDLFRQSPEQCIPISRFFMHFARHFYRGEGLRPELLGGGDRIKSIPIDVIHGAKDWACPVQNAYDYHDAYPHAQLHILPESGHLLDYDPRMQSTFVAIIDRWKAEFKKEQK